MKNTSIDSLPLTGTHLIEASAGTGKTHTITDLFLRFILEKGLTVDQVLIVTYTEAATEELRIRIRQRIRDAVKAFDGGGSSANQLLDTLVKRSPDPQSDRERLQHAVAHFDDAAIFTIHGFCRRLLNDYSYETGLLFDVELITSQDLLFRETVEDFWRKHFYSASKLFISYAIDKKFSPDYFMKLVSSYSHSSWVKIIPKSTFLEIRCLKEVMTLKSTMMIELSLRSM